MYMCVYMTRHAVVLQWETVCCSVLQHTATHCNTLQHTATHCNTLQHTAIWCCYYNISSSIVLQWETVCCRLLQRVAACCNVVQCDVECCSVLQYVKMCVYMTATENATHVHVWQHMSCLCLAPVDWASSICHVYAWRQSIEPAAYVMSLPHPFSSILNGRHMYTHMYMCGIFSGCHVHTHVFSVVHWKCYIPWHPPDREPPIRQAQSLRINSMRAMKKMVVANVVLSQCVCTRTNSHIWQIPLKMQHLPTSTVSQNSNFSVQIQIKPNSQFEFVPQDTWESDFLDLVESGGVAFQWRLS